MTGTTPGPLWPTRLALVLCAVAGVAGGCSCPGAQSAAPPLGDGGPIGATSPSTADAAPRHPLAGKWTGHQMTGRYGMVVGSAEIDADGRGTGVVTAAGLTFTAAITITSFDGDWLEIAVDGVDYQLPTSHTGDQLTVELPVVGRVTLTRHAVR